MATKKSIALKSTVKKAAPKKKELPKLDMNKNYTWDVNAKFPMIGNDFGMMFNKLNTIMTSEWYKTKMQEAEYILGMRDIYRNLVAILEKAVETRIAVENKEEPVQK